MGLLPSSTRQNLIALVMQSSTPAPGAQSPWDSAMGSIEESISQCTFLQMTYTAKNQYHSRNRMTRSSSLMTQQDDGKTDVLLSANAPSAV